MQTYLSLILLLFISFSAFGQIVLLDNENKTPVAFAHVISGSGNLIATSNFDGVIKLDTINKYDNRSLIIQHISYENLELIEGEMYRRDTVFMSKKMFVLPDVIVKSGKIDVLVLKGYFRSYELDNNIHKFYTDGIVEYFIPVAKEKIVKMRLVEYRSYRNNTLIQKEKQRTNTVVMRLAGVPRIGDNSIINAIKKDYDIKSVSKNYIEITKDTAVVGTIKRDLEDNTIHLNIDFIAPNESESKTLFNYTSIITNNELTEIYPDYGLSELSLKDLLRRKKHRKIFFKHKNDNDFEKLEGVDELYIFDKYYINKNEFRKITSSSYAFPESSSYSIEYWKDLSQYNIPATNKNMESSIEEKMSKY